MNFPKNLLPSGFADIVSQDAELEFDIVVKLISVFKKRNYRLIRPSIAEFTENINDPDSFSVLDPVSNQNISFRSDITAQIARIVRGRLKEEKRPIKLCYAGQVLKLFSEGLYKDRQVTQCGLEYIGAEKTIQDIEVIETLVDSLSELGLNDISIDFSLPILVDILLEKITTNLESKERLKKYIRNKNFPAIAEKRKLNEIRDEACLQRVIELMQDQENDFSRKLRDTSLLKSEVEYVEDFIAVITAAKKIKQKGNINFLVDPLGINGFSYQSFLAFSVYDNKTNEEIGRGGKYLISPDAEEKAIGFSLSVDNLVRAISR